MKAQQFFCEMMILPNSLTVFFLSKTGRYLAILLLVGSVVACLVVLAEGILFFTEKSTPPPVSLERQNSATSLSAAHNYHLFGEYIPDSLGKGKVKKSLLNLKLVGIMRAFPEKFSQVIIALPGGKEQIVGVDGKIPGGAKIIKILSEGVLIERNGQIESLSLPKNPLRFESLPQPLPMETY